MARKATASPSQKLEVAAVRPAFAVTDHARALIDELRALPEDEIGLAGDAPAIAYAVQALKRLIEMADWRQRKLR